MAELTVGFFEELEIDFISVTAGVNHKTGKLTLLGSITAFNKTLWERISLRIPRAGHSLNLVGRAAI